MLGGDELPRHVGSRSGGAPYQLIRLALSGMVMIAFESRMTHMHISVIVMLMADDDRQRRLADAFTDVIVASQKLASAARDKFGAAGDALQTSAIPKEEAARIN